eukprot:304072-Chlamydomonas_euryale.AAC.2
MAGAYPCRNQCDDWLYDLLFDGQLRHVLGRCGTGLQMLSSASNSLNTYSEREFWERDGTNSSSPTECFQPQRIYLMPGKLAL